MSFIGRYIYFIFYIYNTTLYGGSLLETLHSMTSFRADCRKLGERTLANCVFWCAEKQLSTVYCWLRSFVFYIYIYIGSSSVEFNFPMKIFQRTRNTFDLFCVKDNLNNISKENYYTILLIQIKIWQGWYYLSLKSGNWSKENFFLSIRC